MPVTCSPSFTSQDHSVRQGALSVLVSQYQQGHDSTQGVCGFPRPHHRSAVQLRFGLSPSASKFLSLPTRLTHLFFITPPNGGFWWRCRHVKLTGNPILKIFRNTQPEACLTGHSQFHLSKKKILTSQPRSQDQTQQWSVSKSPGFLGSWYVFYSDGSFQSGPWTLMW